MPRPIHEAAELLLWRLAKAGDLDARNALLLVHMPLAVAMAKRRYQHAAEISDRCQEAVIGAMIGIEEWEPGRGGRLSTIMGRCIVRHFGHLTQASNTRKRRAVWLDSHHRECREALANVIDRHTEDAGWLEDRLTLVEALRFLPTREREIVLMHEVEGLDYREIGDRFGFTKARAKVLADRALMKLCERLEPSYA